MSYIPELYQGLTVTTVRPRLFSLRVTRTHFEPTQNYATYESNVITDAEMDAYRAGIYVSHSIPIISYQRSHHSRSPNAKTW